MSYNCTKSLADCSKNQTSSYSVTSPNVTSSLEIVMKGSSGVVIARITTQDYRSKKRERMTSYFYIPENQDVWKHHVDLTVTGKCGMISVGVCLKGLFSGKQKCVEKKVGYMIHCLQTGR